MKVWEETWRQSEAYPADVFGEDGGDVLLEGDSPTAGNVNLEEVSARAKLAAAAPDMARALLRVEWLGERGCPECDGPSHKGHKPDCVLDAALRKAGVR